MAHVENNLVVVPLGLGSSGVAYMIGQLNKVSFLANAVLQRFGERGKVYALVPEGTSLERALEFEQGGLSNVGGFGNALARMLSDLYGEDCQLIFEDAWCSQNDVDPKRIKTNYFYSDGHPYYIPNGKNMESKVDEGTREVNCWLCIGYIVKPSYIISQNGQEVEDSEIAVIADNVQAVILWAYDHESFLLWQKG